jgi:uncharacterized protein with HEPN domain
MKDDAVYIDQILDAISKIEKFTTGMNKENFDSNQMAQSAVIMQLILIGELAKKISTKTKDMLLLPWKDIAGFRDRAIHDYMGIDLKIVWGTVDSDIPVLKKALRSI